MRVGRLLAYQGSYISHAPEAYGRVPPWQCRSAGARYGTLAAGWNRHGLWFCWKNIARHEAGNSHVRQRELPDSVLWRPCPPVRPLRAEGLFLPLLPQPRLSEVSPRPNRTLDRPATATVASLFLLPNHLHASGRVALLSAISSQDRLRRDDEGCSG